MDARPPRNVLLVMAVVLFALLTTAALTQITGLLFLGLVATMAILWLEGYVRFRRLRRFVRSLGHGLGQALRFRKMTTRSLRNLGVAAVVILGLVVLNQVQLAGPGEGRGLSVPAEAFSADVAAGFSSPGAVLATILAYGAIATILGLGWYRLWQEVAKAGGMWRARVYLACIVSFFMLPLFFAVMMATAAPKDIGDNIEFSKALVRTVSVGMAFTFSAAVALPFVGEAAPVAAPTPSTPPVLPTYAPFAPPTRGR